MDIETKHRVDEYLQRLHDLYAQVRGWLADQPVILAEKSVAITEMLPGQYQAPSLEVVSQTGAPVAVLQPIGSWIIGALGRVDLSGTNDTAVLLYLPAGGGQWRVTIGGEETRTAPFFRGVDHSGWYWIENVRLGRARSVDGELFLDLLVEVSDYER
jgi:hypothetical protein